MIILFTCSDTVGSEIIRELTSAPISHCALLCGDKVLQASEYGVVLNTLEDFTQTNHIVYQVNVEGSELEFEAAVKKYQGHGYDYGALLYFGLYLLMTRLGLKPPKKNLWHTSGMFICSELVSTVVLGKDTALLTPIALYQELSKCQQP